MNRGGIGSASLILIFAVLCLTIFAVISFISATTDKVLVNMEVQMVKNYYNADVLAEQVLAEILASEETPDNVMGVEIISYWDWDLLAERVFFTCPISETHVLYVDVAISEYSYRILSWRMYKIGEWEADGSLNLWQGAFDDD